tara:strand:- start:2786 stop:3901 length:1116 start_codon:yes stop_codon:yes gene_type:complete
MEIKQTLYIKKAYCSAKAAYELKYEKIWVIDNSDNINIVETTSDFLKAVSSPLIEYIPNKGDKLFFLPGCSVPRFKMKTFCEKYKTAMVKYKESATALFIGPDSFKNMVCGLPSYTFTRSSLEKYFLSYAKTSPMREALLETDYKHVYFDYGVHELLKNEFGKSFNSPHLTSDEEFASYRFSSDEDYKNYNLILGNNKIYHQDDILKRINTGAVMTEEQYISIQRLFKSSDIQNHKVALEIMSNCDYEKSCVYLLLLIHNYERQLYACPTKNHVNFKSLLKFFGLNGVESLDLDDIINSLISRKLLNKLNLDILMPMAIDELSDAGGYKHFIVDKIKVSELVDKALEDNILDGTRDTMIIDDQDDELNPTI